ncbi:ubiquinone biosynthesis accessory factor UbiJ [Legionella yabuuchiae]|uniref:ubiquinone biosynthesis accessory factor UbiJ n=1 Tax=Legionella yabuuchiae TaxID=376727 RepID=UPI001054B4CF|nr:SCP2 sterol-binding domain-containing protein [Legionella yabuuchiae]
MIKTYTLKGLQTAINHALSLDEASAARISALQGKVLKVIINPLKVSFFISFSGTKLQLHDFPPSEVNTIIESSPLGLIRLSLLPASKVRSLFNDQIKLTGDTELGQQVKQLFDELDIDWEGHLAQFTGDVVAYQLGSFIRKGQEFTAYVSSSMQQNLTEYLQEEVKCFPPAEEVEDFCKDVDELLLDVERLTAQVNQLMADHEKD